MNFKKSIMLFNSTITVISLFFLLLFISIIFSSLRPEFYQVTNIKLDSNIGRISTLLDNIKEERDILFIIKEVESYNFKLIIIDNNKEFIDQFKKIPKRVIENIINKWSNTTTTYFYDGVTFIGKKLQNNTIIAYSYGEYSETKQDETFKNVLIRFVLTCGLAIILIIPLGIMFSKKIIEKLTKPLDELKKGAKRIEKGDLTKDIYTNYDNEFREVSIAFNDMQRHLKKEQEKNAQYEKARQEMINGISHDLRTPLTSVKGYIKGIKDGIATTPEKQKEYLEIAYQKSIEIETMLNNFFESFNLEDGNLVLKKEEIDIYNYLSKYIKANKIELDKNVKIKLTKPKEKCKVNIDINQMDRVFNNLIENTIKYTDKKDINITIKIKKEKNIHIIYQDNGPGVKDENISKLTNEFYREDNSRNGKIKGSGLGLFIVKRVIELHNGKIEIKNNNGFYCDIELEVINEKNINS